MAVFPSSCDFSLFQKIKDYMIDYSNTQVHPKTRHFNLFFTWNFF